MRCRAPLLSTFAEPQEGSMPAHRPDQRRMIVRVLSAALLAMMVPSRLLAANITACTTLNFCYCINGDLLEAISGNVARVRQLLADEKAQGKAIGYMSI